MADQTNLVSRESKTKVLVIEPGDGYTAAAVAALLNKHEAVIHGSEIVAQCAISDEGYRVVARIVSSNHDNKSTSWEVDEPHACCPATPQGLDRSRANSVRNISTFYIQQQNWTVAASLLSAARTLLENSGGFDCEEGVWVLSNEAIVACETGDKERGLTLMRQAAEIAQQVLGAAHPAAGICIANLGETLLDAGNAREAEPALSRGIKILAAATPDKLYTRQYLDGALQGFRARLHEAQAALPHSQDI